VKVITQAFGYRLLIFSLGDHDVTPNVHIGTYPEIDPAKTDFSGKAVFVTGGSRGMGRTIVLRFEMDGALHIAAAARSDMSQLAKGVEAAAASANRRPPKFLPVRLGVSGPKIVADAAATIEKEFGMWDVLVDNAGIIGDLRLLGDSDPAGWWGVVDMNGTYHVCKALLPLMQKTGDAYVVTFLELEDTWLGRQQVHSRSQN
jgi:NAD(P)-dependent dehydrogenase (short-subunit alcohol dehydrogenase family)